MSGILVVAGVITTWWAVPEVKRAVVRTMLFKIEDEFGTEQAKMAFPKLLEAYLKDHKASEEVYKVMDDYFKDKGKSFDHRFGNRWQEELSRVIAYSYSSVFPLNESRKFSTLRYAKPDGNKGTIDCIVTYPLGDVNNPIRLTINNNPALQRAIIPGTVPPSASMRGDGSRVGRDKIELASSNAELFPAGIRPNIEQTVSIEVDDTPPIKGTIWVDCSVQIIGPAQLPKPSATPPS